MADSFEPGFEPGESDHSNSGSENSSETNNLIPKDMDTYLSIGILLISLIIVGFVVYTFRSIIFGSTKLSAEVSDSFTPPKEVNEYIDYRKNANIKDIYDLDKLRHLLMRRALKSIPIIIDHQNSSASLDRLYRSGFVQDDAVAKHVAIKKFLDIEIKTVQEEASTLSTGWGEQIWSEAMQATKKIQSEIEEVKQKIGSHSSGSSSSSSSNSSNSSNSGGKKKGKGGKSKSDSSNGMNLEGLTPEEKAEKMAEKLLAEEDAELKKQGKGKK